MTPVQQQEVKASCFRLPDRKLYRACRQEAGNEQHFFLCGVSWQDVNMALTEILLNCHKHVDTDRCCWMWLPLWAVSTRVCILYISVFILLFIFWSLYFCSYCIFLCFYFSSFTVMIDSWQFGIQFEGVPLCFRSHFKILLMTFASLQVEIDSKSGQFFSFYLNYFYIFKIKIYFWWYFIWLFSDNIVFWRHEPVMVSFSWKHHVFLWFLGFGLLGVSVENRKVNTYKWKCE